MLDSLVLSAVATIVMIVMLGMLALIVIVTIILVGAMACVWLCSNMHVCSCSCIDGDFSAGGVGGCCYSQRCSRGPVVVPAVGSDGSCAAACAVVGRVLAALCQVGNKSVVG